MPKHPVPKKKTSKAKSSSRYKAFQNKARIRLKEAIQLTTCSNCKSKTRLHHVCPECGFYGGKDVMNKVEKAEAKIETIKAE